MNIGFRAVILVSGLLQRTAFVLEPVVTALTQSIAVMPIRPYVHFNLRSTTSWRCSYQRNLLLEYTLLLYDTVRRGHSPVNHVIIRQLTIPTRWKMLLGRVLSSLRIPHKTCINKLLTTDIIPRNIPVVFTASR